MGSKLEGKVSLVTGAGRGLGRAFALKLAKLGSHVIVNDIDLSSARLYGEKLTAPSVMDEIENLGRRSMGVQADVTKKKEVKKMFNRIIEEFGHLDILVNNAGGNLNPLGSEAGFPYSYPSSASEENLRFIIDLNLIGTIYCCQAASSLMKEQKYGKIVNIASMAGLHITRDMLKASAYSLAKAGVIHYTKCIAAELGPHNINVNCIAPSRVNTARALAQRRELDLKGVFKLNEQENLSSIENVTNVVEFLVTNLSDGVNGHCIPVFTSSSRFSFSDIPF
jgi:NAD(P)-dependent dehydrogenase (short-subunit alcohol dehydrogenase family)